MRAQISLFQIMHFYLPNNALLSFYFEFRNFTGIKSYHEK